MFTSVFTGWQIQEGRGFRSNFQGFFGESLTTRNTKT